jgi:signal transduction histidine kinase
MSAPMTSNRRILVIDDNRAIHQDFRKILCPRPANTSLAALEAELFGGQPEPEPALLPGFEVDSAYQGEEGVRLLQTARREGRPYAMAFVDIRMPPGIDGVETSLRLWEEDPNLQVVICSAYADYSWENMMQRLGLTQRLLILRKPFDGIEVLQLAYALTEKWELLRRSQLRMEDLTRAVDERTRELEAANARLRREMEERTQLEARLAQAQRLEALGRLSAGLAHEVNNPLSFILSNLSHLRSALDGDLTQLSEADQQELREVCGESIEGAERIRRIIADIRLFSRLEAQPRVAVDVREVLEQALFDVSNLLGPGVRLVRELQEVPAVSASEHGLRQVFFGLLANAVQALKGRGPDAWVRVSSRLHEEGYVVVEVQDNGVGITPQHLDRVFDPFFTTKQQGSGTGLGLSICYGIVSGLGGDITVESVPERGSTFRVLLPPLRTEREEQPNTSPPE